ncbi:MAG: tRNA glutamyl-Q(34) synthetase GluQRS [Xanthomonadales bacterium]|nr:tRNA glutamyl-Q(34) synthetase GluQRS [Xanthomonadales bacterium]
MSETTYIGRFAPSPTGALHFGSLVAAVGSYLQARRHGGRWLIRIEDLDPPRVVPGSEAQILADLSRFGMASDGPIVRQSERSDAYEAALADLDEAGLLFPCACTRSELPPGPYPGTCRNGLPPGREGRSLRVRVPDVPLAFTDQLQGPQTENLAETSGDFVVRRADGFYAYQLAVVVDDAWQGITEVVRGADLLDSTGRQRYLQSVLGFPHPRTLHLPIVLDDEGRKLGKRFGADPVERLPTLEALGAALRFLGHPPPDHGSLEARWRWAIANWNPAQVPP